MINFLKKKFENLQDQNHWKELARLIPAGFYNGIIWLVSSGPLPVSIGNYDKTAHILEYGILGFLLSFALNISKNNFDIPTKYVIFWVVLAGLTDEIHQYFVPGRSMDIIDLTADIIGGFLGILIWFALTRVIKRTPNSEV